MYSKKQNKISELLLQELSKLFCKYSTKYSLNKQVIVSITQVNINANCSESKIYLSIFSKKYKNEIFNEIKKNTFFYQKYIFNKLGKLLRIIPNIIFILDTSLENLEQINKELKGIGNNPFL